VLVVTATQDFRHDEAIAASKVRLAEAGAASELRFDFTEDPAALNASNLARYDVLFLNNATLRIAPMNPTDSASVAAAHWPRGSCQSITREQQDAIASFVRGGKGLVVVHSGIDAFYGWPEYRVVVGGGLFRITRTPATHASRSRIRRIPPSPISINGVVQGGVLLPRSQSTADQPRPHVARPHECR
jgi:hypothetical protein